MTDIDKKLITRKLAALKDYLHKLAELQRLDYQIYTSDHRNYGLAEHYLQQAIEVVLDVAGHFILVLELTTPEDSHGLLTTLRDAGILSASFVERNFKMPGFRNRLVHVYEEIDHQKTYEYLQEHLADFEEFSRQISKFLLKHKD